jgi:hypothetical protein
MGLSALRVRERTIAQEILTNALLKTGGVWAVTQERNSVFLIYAHLPRGKAVEQFFSHVTRWRQWRTGDMGDTVIHARRVAYASIKG